MSMPSYNRGNSTYICHLDKNGGRQARANLFIKTLKKDVGLLIA